MTPPSSPDDTERATLAACSRTCRRSPRTSRATPTQLRAWLGERGLGLVPVDDAATSLGGSVDRAPSARDTGGPQAVVMFGVPSGPIWTPPHDRRDPRRLRPRGAGHRGWPPQTEAEPARPRRGARARPRRRGPGLLVDEAVAVVGEAWKATATRRDRHLRLRPVGQRADAVDAAVLDSSDGDLDHRRNVVVRGTDLNALVGQSSRSAKRRCRGRRLCEPCAHLDRLNDGGVLRPLVHRGGLRADIVEDGTVRLGDRLTPA